MNKVNKHYKRAAGLFYSRDEAEAAVRGLKNNNFDMDRVSVIARDADKVAGANTTDTKQVGNKADDGATTGALTGGALGGIGGLLVGLGVLAIPGIGPILLAGAEATAIATTIAGAGIGAVAGGLIGALIGLGIPEERARIYRDRVAGGSFLVMVTGTAAEISRAENLMKQHGVEEFGIYDVPGATPTQVADVDDDIRTRTDISDTDKIRLYEERLMVNKQREKAGEVAVGKKVSTETARVSVPVEKERVVVERTTPDSTTQVTPGSVNFGTEEVARVDVYEETADIKKQAFVREEVNIRKEVEQDTVRASEKVRREELDVDVDGNPVIDRGNRNYPPRTVEGDR
ncbi:YsnF/AvaK domain-containing protein [Myxosarcina sp. GI1]|uniref:YsnF/AvaK domain-containing protein n=1 Tax=Myxosarcina sp. GI1 TaxID=1541065 RepID=UPI0006909C05|nr:YsnF/AvaK domain-containing protein [Myxosarcina sp. GI1]